MMKVMTFRWTGRSSSCRRRLSPCGTRSNMPPCMWIKLLYIYIYSIIYISYGYLVFGRWENTDVEDIASWIYFRFFCLDSHISLFLLVPFGIELVDVISLCYTTTIYMYLYPQFYLFFSYFLSSFFFPFLPVEESHGCSCWELWNICHSFRLNLTKEKCFT